MKFYPFIIYVFGIHLTKKKLTCESIYKNSGINYYMGITLRVALKSSLHL